MSWVRILFWAGAATLGLVFIDAAAAFAQPVAPEVTIRLPNAEEPEQVVPALKVLLLLTVLSIAPAILVSMTSFTRIVVVLTFVRQALGTQNAPPMQVVLSLALMMTVVVMAPVGAELNAQALDPYVEHQIDEEEMYTRASNIISTWLIRQTREDDLELFYELSHESFPDSHADVSLHLLVPAFMISELRTGFEMGFLLFLPFVLIDLITATVLTSMGMMMLPPTMVSTPAKLLLFVVVDGWALLTRSVVASFGG